VNHDILLDKLCQYGIHGTTLLWFRSYLEKRRQRVQILYSEIRKTSSGWETIKNGVPQGSILSPLLFLLYIIDSPLAINIDYKLLLYADDISVQISGPDIQEIQSKPLIALDSINKWFTTTGLSLNIKKTKIMIFESNP
jgi:hypothetical protein